MRVVLSSRLTFFYKLVFPAGFAMGAMLFAAVGDVPGAFGFLAATTFLILYSGPVKEVTLADKRLIVSNGFREVRLPLDLVEAIEERLLLAPRLARVYLSDPSSFGSCIMFHPRGWSLLRESAATMELRRAVQRVGSPPLAASSGGDRPA